MRTQPAASVDPVLRDLGLRLAELRAAKGLTQATLAEEVGVSLRYVQAIEGGRQNLKVLSLSRFADALGTSMADLFCKPKTRKRGPGRPPKAA